MHFLLMDMVHTWNGVKRTSVASSMLEKDQPTALLGVIPEIIPICHIRAAKRTRSRDFFFKIFL